MFNKFSKYGNKKVVVDNIKFDSIKESKRYLELMKRQKNGYITDLTLQPRYLLQDAYRNKDGKAIRKIEYIADFKYYSLVENREVIEDVKGSPTFQDPVFKIKKKMLLFKFRDIEFREIYKYNE